MSRSRNRLERLLSEELGQCCDDDVDRRLDALSDLESTALPADVADHVTALTALASDTRYRIARLLAAGDELCVCELSPLLDVSASAVSHALADLREAGLIERRKEGRWRYYRTTARAEAIIDALDATDGPGVTVAEARDD
jgi:DNA-binding transcriptional ArsR family regulator